MTSQPQPTAALSDAELIDSIEMDTGLSAGTIRDVLAALPQAGYRLARAAPPFGQVCVSRFTAQRAQRWEAEARKSQWTPMDDERASRDLRSALDGAAR